MDRLGRKLDMSEKSERKKKPKEQIEFSEQ